MKYFSILLRSMSKATSTKAKVELMISYFRNAPSEDKCWALYILCGNTLKRKVSSPILRDWISEVSGFPLWLVEESYHVVGDLAETLALLNPHQGEEDDDKPLSWWMNFLSELDESSLEERKSRITSAWKILGPDESWGFNKIITGGLRIGVSKSLVIRALAELSGISTDIIALRLVGRIVPYDFDFDEITSPSDAAIRKTIPYPFFLAYALEGDPSVLGNPSEWIAEWKWDGIRAQIVKRGESVSVWSRGDELLSEGFPELASAMANFSRDIVIDGELIGWTNGAPLPFAKLQKRIMRKRLTPALLREIPAVLLAYDLLEIDGLDIRERSFSERRSLLQDLIAPLGTEAPLKLSPILSWNTWLDLRVLRSNSRDELAEGIMLKRASSTYQVGRRRGDWWKWKVDPYSVDAVLVYAQKGHGRRADLFTDYTFAVWDNDTLVPFAKAYSGLTDEEIRKVDRWVRNHTREKFGPVRTVEPQLVFEIAFEGIQFSKRHKSGVAVRFPRIVRWRIDKQKGDADNVETLRRLVQEEPSKTKSVTQ